MAYERALHECALDETLESLQRIDILLSQVRRELIKGSIWDESALLLDEHYRNFMMFVAFYAGRVLAQQRQQTLHWYGQFELRKRYADLPLVSVVVVLVGSSAALAVKAVSALSALSEANVTRLSIPAILTRCSS